MRLVQADDAIHVKSDELTWVLVSGGAILVYMSWELGRAYTKIWPDQVLYFCYILIWLFIICRSNNTTYSIFNSKDIVLLKKKWLFKKQLILESEKRYWTKAELVEYGQSNQYSICIEISGVKYILFNWYSTSNKVLKAHKLLSKELSDRRDSKESDKT